MRRVQRIVVLVVSTGAAPLLIVALFRLFGATTTEFYRALLAIPPWAYAVAWFLSFLNLLAVTLKWRLTMRWLTPSIQPPPFQEMMRATTLGSLLGNFTHAQAGLALIRWTSARKHTGPASWAIGTTFFEQLYDLMLVTALGSAGLAIMAFDTHWTLALAILGVTLSGCFLGLHGVFRIGARLCRAAPAFLTAGSRLGPLEHALRRAADCPPGTSLPLLGWSIFRLAALMLNTLLLAAFLAPGARTGPILAGYPVVALVAVLPTTPAGLGVVEWSWGGILVLAGATSAQAATAAVAFRVINIGLQSLVFASLPVIQGAWRRRPSRDGTA